MTQQFIDITKFGSTYSASKQEEIKKVINDNSVDAEFRLSSLEVGRESSTTTGMTVLTNTNGEIGTWADVTTAAASLSDSPVTMFPGVTTNNAIYFIRAIEFGGFRLTDLSVLMVPGAGAIIFEYWDNSTWVNVNIMETDSTDLEDGRANNAFVTKVNGTLELRIGDTTGWAEKTLNGFTGFCLRVRITADITTPPVFEQSRLHNNAVQIDINGQIQLLGGARRLTALASFNRLEDLTGFGAGNTDVDTSTNTTVQLKNNSRGDGAKDGSGVVATLPSGVDTSFNIEVIVQWAVKNDTAGDVENSVALSSYSAGAVLDGSLTETVVSVITPVNTQQDQIQVSIFSFDINEAIQDSNLSVGVFRDATGGNANDTFVGNSYIVSIQLRFKRWR